MTRLCILHCGQPKTGTSSLQRFLAENAGELARHGILYPTLALPKDPSTLLPWVGYQHGPGLRQQEKQAEVINPASDLGQIRRQIETLDHDVLVLSAEYLFYNLFYGGFDYTVTYLRDRGYRIETINYLRDQPGWLNSLYAQTCKTGEGQGRFDAFCTNLINRNEMPRNGTGPIIGGSLHYARLADPTLHTWGRHSFRPFSEEVRARGIEADFLATLREVLARNGKAATLTEAACQALRPTPRSNDRDGTVLVALCRQIGNMVVRRIPSPRPLIPLRKRGERAVYPAAVAALEKLGIRDPKFQALTPQRDADLRRIFVESNEVFARTIWGCGWRDVFPPESQDRLVCNDLAECDDAELHAHYEAALPLARANLRRALDRFAPPLPQP